LTKLSIFIYDRVIVVQNPRGQSKQFPRCGITQVESFVKDMAEKGNLNELIA